MLLQFISVKKTLLNPYIHIVNIYLSRFIFVTNHSPVYFSACPSTDVCYEILEIRVILADGRDNAMCAMCYQYWGI